MKKHMTLVLIVFAVTVIQASLTDQRSLDKAELGKLLFFDPILSKTKTISCASCHKPAYAFADTSAVSSGVKGRKGVRNTPSVMNITQQRLFFWDGRAKSMEEQVLAPIENPVEMDLPLDNAIARLRNNKQYSVYFSAVFHREPDRAGLAEAIAAFERTLETSDSPFDNWKFSDDPHAVSEAVKRGFVVFNGKGKCVQCHFGADFTTQEFRNIGLFDGKRLNDSGQAVISGLKEDLGKFKVPTLRNIGVTGPYMHNGMFKTLKQVIDFYDDPGKIVRGDINRDSVLTAPLGLTAAEKSDLRIFLLSLTDKQFSKTKARH